MAVRMRHPDEVKVRIEHLFWFIAACYLALVARLVYLQAVNGEFYRSKAKHMRAQLITLPSDRGTIMDRGGRPIAVTVQRSQFVADPTRINNPARTAATLAGILAQKPDDVLPYIKLGRRTRLGAENRHVVLPTPIDSDIIDRYRSARAARKTSRDLDGIAIETIPERTYPTGRESVHLAGFLVREKTGKPSGFLGLEQSQESVLQGADGFVRAEVDARRRVIPDTQVQRLDAADGLNVRLTIDTNIQHIAETSLAAYCVTNKPLGATAIVVDPTNGDVLAMVSYPNFDPIKRDELRMSQDPLMNRSLALFEPGSTMKTITAAAALEQKVITTSTPFYCNGSVEIGHRTVKCASHHGSRAHGSETIREIIQHSCNCATAEIGVKVGMDRMKDYLGRFGLLDQTGIGLPLDMRGRLGFGAGSDRGGVTKVSRVAFGQSVLVNPLAMAAAYAAVANNGILMKPRLIQSYEDSDGRVIRSFPPVKVRQAILPETSAYLRSLLELVVTNGTGKGKANVPGYRVAGKTGTAQKVVRGQAGYANGRYVASFIGFLPVSAPKAVIYVVVDEPTGVYYGAQVAAPIFQDIAQRLMWYWKVPPDDPASLVKTQIARR